MEPVLPFELDLDDVRNGGLTRSLHRQLRAAILEGGLEAHAAALEAGWAAGDASPDDAATAELAEDREALR